MDSFLNLLNSVWSEGVYGINLSNIVIGLVILFVFVFFRSLFSNIVVSRIKVIVKKSETQIDDEVLEAFKEPIKFIPIVIGVYVASTYINLNETNAI